MLYQRWLLTGMFPAPAGMNRYQVETEDYSEDVPRTRGDEPEDQALHEGEIECSPHPRG